MISVVPVADAAGQLTQVRVTVHFATTAVMPGYYRVRRASADATPDLRRMPVVYAGPLPTPPAGTDGVSPPPDSFTC